MGVVLGERQEVCYQDRGKGEDQVRIPPCIFCARRQGWRCGARRVKHGGAMVMMF